MSTPIPPSTGRNAPCPCGSGRKWKKCCGSAGAARAAGAAGPDSRSADDGPRGRGPRSAAAEAPRPAASRRLADATRHLAAGRPADAERTALEVLRDSPESSDALLLLGRIRAMVGRNAAAIGPLRAAADLRRRDPEPRLLLAAAHRAARQPDAAEAALREASEVAPADVRAWSLLASLAKERGDAGATRTFVDRAAALAPDDPVVRLLEASLLNDERRAEPALALLDRLARRPPDAASLRAELQSERARALESLERIDEAWAAIEAANREQAADPVAGSIDRGRAAAWMEAYARHLPPGDGPVAEGAGTGPPPFDVLVGFPRSGTTMLEQVLHAHPDVGTGGERPIVQRLKRTLGSLADDPDAFARRIAAMDAEELGLLRRRLAVIAREEVPGGHPRMLHKHPTDSIELPLLDRLVPDARILFAVRDPRDVCISCLKQRFVLNMTNVHFLELETTVALQERVLDGWFAQRERLRGRWLEVRYEKLAGDLPTTARDVLQFLGLDWSDDVLSFHHRAADRWISTPSAQAVREGAHLRAVGGWRRYAGQLARSRPALDRLATRWGYPPD